MPNFLLQPCELQATFLTMLPLRSISRFWGFLTSVVSDLHDYEHIFFRPGRCSSASGGINFFKRVLCSHFEYKVPGLLIMIPIVWLVL
ncbi:hypothetical protein EZV62_012419 [Acer yangbiense]|uniref:Uncharacterized protein n=1 Tax=Acer yangbiense TaxID=1000413 RepID=A0A5C7HXJ0_9ROSI|nr:hypothetical protein EZV62_012419 [Acer yangbiense]